ncbi:cytoplasmic 60S subunit biogenesis factor ZNF622 [Anopheles ziemanni]|uniref:cytoplasmic 60S subunit biogenesis factor ZNF622 n=1 Tax=Anopheles coustani TaxID=139045 RepID=UPI002659BEF8|nr:cytoplasmic 60S subunit biogenesis factor ZNF622 [Anopheles coustani]XP_058171483.1 cytoplasmic 60S subunit biogenesis factor ZNF622 [Anopheles ziemanni]
MSSFTCLNCGVRFATAEMQREHYKTHWHRYNLKRKLAELPPVTIEEFEKRVNQQKSDDAAAQEDQSVYCKACRKVFKSKNAHDNHLDSKKHQENLKRFIEQSASSLAASSKDAMETEVEVTVKSTRAASRAAAAAAEAEAAGDAEMEGDSDEWEDVEFDNPIENNDCIFCPQHSEDLIGNIKHMSLAHSFFIPDAEFCVDVEGLLNYLAEKVCRDYICLWCNERGRTFYSIDAVRKHMTEKGHCKMLHEGAALAEYVDFFDYSSSYPDHEDGMDVDAELETPTSLDGDEYQLVLPSGNVIGHRSLLRYYKQRINPNRAVVVKKSTQKLHKVLAQYRSLGWTSTQQEAAARNARDMHVMKRQQAKLMQKVGVKANKLQHHYRPQVNF